MHLEKPSEKRAEARLPLLLCVLAAALGLVCVVLVSVVITLSIRRKSASSDGPDRQKKKEAGNVTASVLLPVSAVKSEQEGEIKNFTRQILLLGRKTEELTRDRDQLNWTLGVILHYDVFSVNAHCPQRGENTSRSSGAFTEPQFWPAKPFKDP